MSYQRLCWVIFFFVAALIIAPGTQAQGPLQVQVVQVDQSQFPLINVYVSVTDAGGRPVKTLLPQAFRLEESGQSRTLEHVSRAGEQGPVTAVLVIDKSGSMGNVGKMRAAQEAAIAFVRLMRPADVTGVIAFDTKVEVRQALTSDQEVLVQAIQGLTPKGDTALRDALYAATEMLAPVSGRKAIIVVTDGLDNRSTHTQDELLTLVGEHGLSIYTIGLGDPARPGDEDAGYDEAALQAIAAGSGGLYLFTPQPAELQGLYEMLSARIQNEYRLTYTSPNPLRDGSIRTITVEVVTDTSPTRVQARYNPGGVIPEVAPARPTGPVFLTGLLVLGLLLVLPTLVGWGRRLLAGQPRPATGPTPPKPRIRLTDEPAEKRPRARRKRQK